MPLPNFLIIGAARAGTSSLHQYLGAHPDVYMCPVKEPRFFAWDSGTADNPRREERGLFPIRDLATYSALFRGVTSESAIGEASPVYLASASAPYRINETLPDVRLIVSLRDPVLRAYSEYKMSVRSGWERRPIEEALHTDEYRVQAGRYGESLARYLDVFAPKRIKVLIFEHWTRRPDQTLDDLFEFLDVEPNVPVDTAVRYDPGGVPRSKTIERVARSPVGRLARAVLPPPLLRSALRLRRWNHIGPAQAPTTTPAELPSPLHESLVDFYRDDVEKLQKLIGVDLSLWLDDAAEAQNE